MKVLRNFAIFGTNQWKGFLTSGRGCATLPLAEQPRVFNIPGSFSTYQWAQGPLCLLWEASFESLQTCITSNWLFLVCACDWSCELSAFCSSSHACPLFTWLCSTTVDSYPSEITRQNKWPLLSIAVGCGVSLQQQKYKQRKGLRCVRQKLWEMLLTQVDRLLSRKLVNLGPSSFLYISVCFFFLSHILTVQCNHPVVAGRVI